MMKVIDVNKILSEIIPPDDYQHRNGFSNEHLIDKLSDEEKFKVEAELINMLQRKTDMLIVETLGYMKSEKSLSVLYELLESLNDKMSKIITAISIFEINRDQKMIETATVSFKTIKDKFQLISAFHYLVRFQNPEISRLIEEYTTNSDYLISYNAKQVLGKL
jgi:hypothetical protein